MLGFIQVLLIKFNFNFLWQYMYYIKMIIDEVAAREEMKTEQQILKINPDIYKIASNIELIMGHLPFDAPKKEKQHLQAGVDELKGLIEGNID